MTTVFMEAEDGELKGTPEQQQEQLNRLVDFGLHKQMDIIKNFTFRTEFVNISRKQAAAWRLYNIEKEMNEEESSEFNQLKKNVNDAIEKIRRDSGRSDARVFIKLSSRSPKDAVARDHQRIVPILKEQLKKVKKNDLNGRMHALRQSLLLGSAVSSADEAFKLMALSSRIVMDLKVFLDHSTEDSWLDVKLVVREFCEDLDVCNEYRGFVKGGGKLTAVSQYQTEIVSEVKKEEIASKLRSFFENEMKSVPDAVVDFAVIGDRVLVIELNPFGECSGSALFDWKEDHDVLFGDAPFEIRVVEEPPDHLMERFTPW